MGWLAYILGRKPSAAPHAISIRPRYDAAATTDANRKHGANADGRSADAAASPEVTVLFTG